MSGVTTLKELEAQIEYNLKYIQGATKDGTYAARYRDIKQTFEDENRKYPSDKSLNEGPYRDELNDLLSLINIAVIDYTMKTSQDDSKVRDYVDSKSKKPEPTIIVDSPGLSEDQMISHLRSRGLMGNALGGPGGAPPPPPPPPPPVLAPLDPATLAAAKAQLITDVAAFDAQKLKTIQSNNAKYNGTHAELAKNTAMVNIFNKIQEAVDAVKYAIGAAGEGLDIDNTTTQPIYDVYFNIVSVLMPAAVNAGVDDMDVNEAMAPFVARALSVVETVNEFAKSIKYLQVDYLGLLQHLHKY